MCTLLQVGRSGIGFNQQRAERQTERQQSERDKGGSGGESEREGGWTETGGGGGVIRCEEAPKGRTSVGRRGNSQQRERQANRQT